MSGAGCGFGHFILKSEKKIVTFVQLTAKRQSDMLSIAERHKYILDNLNKYGFVRITDVANELDRKSTRLNSSHTTVSRMPSSA